MKVVWIIEISFTQTLNMRSVDGRKSFCLKQNQLITIELNKNIRLFKAYINIYKNKKDFKKE